MNRLSQPNQLKKILIVLLLATGFWTGFAQAGMVSTSEMIAVQSETLDRETLQTALESEQLRTQLQAMGVDVEQLQERVASLTPAEIHQLNNDIEHQEAGGLLGVLLTIFVIFVITDMLCATDLFAFVKCINR